MNKIQVALCAFGMSGKVFHAPLLMSHPAFELTHIWVRNPQVSVSQYPKIQVVRDYEAILSNPDIELIVVNTPEPTHFDLTWKALEAKKHVVVEKAFTPTVEEGKKLIEFAHSQGLLLTVYQNRRWDSDFMTVRSVIEQKLLGRLTTYEAHYNRYRNFIQTGSWKEKEVPGTGVLYNLGSHLIDQALVLFGMPTSIWADMGIQRPGGKVMDNFDLLMRYDHMKVMLRVSYMVPKVGAKYILHGDKGSFYKPSGDPQEEALKQGGLPLEADWGKEGEEDWGDIFRYEHDLEIEGKIRSLPGNYMAFYDQLHKAIREEGELPVAPEEALNTIRIIEAAQESHSHNKAVFL